MPFPTGRFTGHGRDQIEPFPLQLSIGLMLVAIAWPTAWFGPTSFAEQTFFPLWLGYILTADGIVRRRTGTSLLTRGPRRFLTLFLCSIPLWWLFEAFNNRLGNWEYLAPREYGFLTFHARSSLSFSTVIPALFETAELFQSTGFVARHGRWRRVAPPRRGLVLISVGGASLLVVCLAFPNQAYGLVWLGLFFLLDPLNHLLGGHSISARVARGRWDTVLALWAAGLTCGFFWEMWNYWAMPKWIYHVPYLSQPRLFEMPLLGYGGYPPFALEVYAAYQAILLLARRTPDDYLHFDRLDPSGTSPAGTAAPAATR